ncbi:helix-turn-helix domain-containing protein [Prauserella flavalba]|uniref:helix-turn-helix domain-containing protein n=1 Tax=Prauserella flavalba TaxID=1477506 RepID=UPI0036F0EC04
MNQDWLTPKQAAVTARRHPVTVYKALEAGELHGHQRKRGGRWLVHPDAVSAWIRGTDGTAACGCSNVRRIRRIA